MSKKHIISVFLRFFISLSIGKTTLRRNNMKYGSSLPLYSGSLAQGQPIAREVLAVACWFSAVLPKYRTYVFSLIEGCVGEVIDHFSFILIWISIINSAFSIFDSPLPSLKRGNPLQFGMTTNFMLTPYCIKNVVKKNIPSITLCQLFRKHCNLSKQPPYLSDCFHLKIIHFSPFPHKKINNTTSTHSFKINFRQFSFL